MLKLYNFLSRKIEEFKPARQRLRPQALSGRPIGKVVGLYTCGPTVYDFVHIGNWRTFVFEDLLKRVLIFDGHKVKHVMNITDIDDKIIGASSDQGIKFRDLAAKYEKAFFKDFTKLNIVKADNYPRATENLTPIIRIIEVLIGKGIAYAKDGSVYFTISKFPDYGKISGPNTKA